MKLNETRPYLETSGELEEQSFSIQDQGMIFDILRNKMYSNPILAICREISCNARDAHREVGTPERPIHIYLPNTLEPYYKVKDFGPGISPDRMTNIFIKYTASTKRDSNIQTGGFGLGAKTPFSYSDSFSIVTNYNGVQYNYSCNIDETKVGKISLMSESPTHEPNGTTIIVPVLPKNFQEFATWTEQACRHWDVKPVIKGGDIAWQPLTKILQGEQWAIVSNNEYYNRDCKIIVDGIEYPLDLDTLKKYADGTLIDSARGKFVMYFGVGELSLSANREQIYLDERTQKIICDRLDLIKKEISQRVQDKVDALTNLWEANLYYRKELRQAFSNLKFLGTITWSGITLDEAYIYTECPVFAFTKGKYSHRRNGDPNKLSRSLVGHFSFDETADLYINDLPLKEPTPRHVKKAFDNDSKLKFLYVVCPTDKVTLDVLNDKIHLDKMSPKKLSDITKASARAYTAPSSRLLLFKYDREAAAFRQVSYASVEEDYSSKVLCTLNKSSSSTRHAVLQSGQTLDHNALNSLLDKFPGHSFYGLDTGTSADRIAEDFSDFEDIQSFIQDNVLDSASVDYLQLKYALKHNHASYQDKIYMNDPHITGTVSPDSPFRKRLALLKKFSTICASDKGILSLYEAVNGEITDADLDVYIKDHPDLDFYKLDHKVDTVYPLLTSLQTWNVQDIAKHIAQYVNLIDKDSGELQ